MKYLLALVPLVLLAGCTAAMNAAGLAASEEALAELLKGGEIDEATYNALVSALHEAFKAAQDKGDWWDIVLRVGEPLLTLVAGYFGIRIWRGSPTARKGSLKVNT